MPWSINGTDFIESHARGNPAFFTMNVVIDPKNTSRHITQVINRLKLTFCSCMVLHFVGDTVWADLPFSRILRKWSGTWFVDISIDILHNPGNNLYNSYSSIIHILVCNQFSATYKHYPKHVGSRHILLWGKGYSQHWERSSKGRYCKPKPCNGDPESIPCPPHSLSDFCQQWSERPKFEIQPNSSTTDAANLLETGKSTMHVFIFDFCKSLYKKFILEQAWILCDDNLCTWCSLTGLAM